MAKRPGDGSAGGTTAALGRPYLVPLSGPRSLRVIKRQIYQGLSQTLAEASQWADREILESLACEDFKDGVAHFREKRVPSSLGVRIRTNVRTLHLAGRPDDVDLKAIAQSELKKLPC